MILFSVKLSSGKHTAVLMGKAYMRFFRPLLFVLLLTAVVSGALVPTPFFFRAYAQEAPPQPQQQGQARPRTAPKSEINPKPAEMPPPPPPPVRKNTNQ